MPSWFKKQMKTAFKNKNIHQIVVLNQCWFFYRKKKIPEK
ncbi:hypothetical protein J2T56_001009 [Natronobacillus azotifigens]|uniref:Cortex morphogenetic protein CmpA n=1 Tax=Natronobacillus azotifigens TaxID=472978 RepID=A0A9J6RAH2_9BACI|nr:cortex morphogenetic protein CmpA [Natronobacillus azotifigens]MCZ0702674.1 cortex morphogenetic protein CmpA [Natronobacillus azotifigens]